MKSEKNHQEDDKDKLHENQKNFLEKMFGGGQQYTPKTNGGSKTRNESKVTLGRRSDPDGLGQNVRFFLLYIQKTIFSTLSSQVC